MNPTRTARAQGERPLDERELEALQSLLDSLPAGHEPLDVVALDGYLCGVLLQPRAVPEALWLAHVADVDGRAPPPGFAIDKLRALVLRRHAELNRAIERRDWFDPWVYQLDAQASPSEAVLPWVAGFATAMDLFPALVTKHEPARPAEGRIPARREGAQRQGWTDQAALLEPLATLYRHLGPDDLEDADALRSEIDTLELPATLPEAVEDLVRSVLLIADVSRPQTRATAARRGPPQRTRRTTPQRR